MAAYNTIVLTGSCPSCRRSCEIRAQTHLASSFDGDARGRFCGREYRVGERMPWFTDERAASWCGEAATCEGTRCVECCYAECTACGADLYAVIELDSLEVKRVVEVGLETEWPSRYPR